MLMSNDELKVADKGYAIDTVHVVGDGLWALANKKL